MKENYDISISEFAALTGIKRTNLIFYDRIGLLSPEHRGENNYRYYSQRQLGMAFLIGELREIGIGIEEIKGYADSRTPKKMAELFQLQEKRIEAEIKKLKHLKGMMRLYVEMAEDIPMEALETIRIVEKKREPLFMGPKTTEKKENEEADLQAFYSYTDSCQIEHGYPLGVVVKKESLLQRQYGVASHFYLRFPFPGEGYKPAGRYVTGYIRSDYGKAGALYGRLMHFIEENQLTICGDAYEECPLNEISIKNADDYIMKVEIMVQ